MDDDLILTPVPSLVATLLNKETEKGGPLTQEEVMAIRDGCHCIAMPAPAHRKMEESRGYRDIDPENVWDEWQIARLELVEAD